MEMECGRLRARFSGSRRFDWERIGYVVGRLPAVLPLSAVALDDYRNSGVWLTLSVRIAALLSRIARIGLAALGVSPTSDEGRWVYPRALTACRDRERAENIRNASIRTERVPRKPSTRSSPFSVIGHHDDQRVLALGLYRADKDRR
jgi:hypothetical protein